jgi:putative transposase
MKKNDYLKVNDIIYRILAEDKDNYLVLNCNTKNMPAWKKESELADGVIINREEVFEILEIELIEEKLTGTAFKQAHERYTMIAGVLAFMNDDSLRNRAIAIAVDTYGISRRTLTTYLCNYLVTDNISSLVPKPRKKNRSLNDDEKIMRWALNKFYYTRYKHKLTDCYIMMLKEKYTDESGKLKEEHPSIHQFRYFFNKTRKKQTELISREGIKEYQLNHRPLLGEGIHDFAPTIGTGMLDGTVCDLYLVDSSGKLVGRPLLVACVDAYSGLCCGYSLLWEGGVYSIREMMLNVIEDKVKWCKQFGIQIQKEQWPCDKLPGVLVTDRGSEYISYNFEQISELGCQVISLPSFSANMKGPVEKLFDLVQDSFKPFLKGYGVIEKDFQKRGIKDYRLESCLTIEQFEKIIIHTIIYYNNRVLENFPYSDDMMKDGIVPSPAGIWDYQTEYGNSNLLSVSKEQLVLTLLPRTEGRFTRKGLVVNKMRYDADGFTEEYLNGEKCTVAFNPDDASVVWLLKEGDYIKFSLIEKKYNGMSVDEVHTQKKKQKQYVAGFREDALVAKVDLAQKINTIVEHALKSDDTDITGVTKRRQKARIQRHRNLTSEVINNE